MRTMMTIRDEAYTCLLIIIMLLYTLLYYAHSRRNRKTVVCMFIIIIIIIIHPSFLCLLFMSFANRDIIEDSRRYKSHHANQARRQ
jgi:hypothetical protein